MRFNMTKKQSELIAAKKFMLEDYYWQEHWLVRINRRNVALVEAMMRTDSSYRRSFDRNAKPSGNYSGSSAYWFTRLKEFGRGVVEEKLSYETIIQESVNAVDRENSTHINADNVGRTELTRRLQNYQLDELLQHLRVGDLVVYDRLKQRTQDDGGIRHRVNPSFASKYCHYACVFLFDGQKEEDNYPIFDSIIRKALPLYLAYYGLEYGNLDIYCHYRKAIDDVIEASKSKISRNGFDHLIWYYHKGSLPIITE